jgi:methionyl-tRNA formyltransferase
LARTFGAVKGKLGEVTAVGAGSMFITAQGGQIEVAKGKLGSGKKVSPLDLGIAAGTILGG